MTKRLFDVCFSLGLILLLSPVLLLVSMMIKIFSKGPVLYIAQRAGLNGKTFKLLKFRTMNLGADEGSAITGVNDNRIFPTANFLRKIKLDELPQFFNVLIGEMSVVGPRPEDVNIVKRYYVLNEYKETLNVRPGIVSPGSLFNYTHGHLYIDDQDPETSYVQKFLPVKLALEHVYLKRQNFLYDMSIIFRTLIVIIQIAFGKRNFPMPQEFIFAKELGLI